VSQLPLFEMSCPTKNSRKLRIRSEEKVVSSKAARTPDGFRWSPIRI
jgi:hypothetical protein